MPENLKSAAGVVIDAAPAMGVGLRFRSGLGWRADKHVSFRMSIHPQKFSFGLAGTFQHLLGRFKFRVRLSRGARRLDRDADR